MIDHIALDVSDIARSRAFYEAALAPLGIRIIREEPNASGQPAVLMGDHEIFFTIAEGSNVARDAHIAFRARTSGEVDAFHAAALAAGGIDHGAPGLRPRYEGRYYAAFVRDPDGLNVEAVCHLEKNGDDLHHRL